MLTEHILLRYLIFLDQTGCLKYLLCINRHLSHREEETCVLVWAFDANF